LAFERSGYLHPAFVDFIDLFSRCSSSRPNPQTVLLLKFAVSFAITFSTASLLKSAAHRLLPRSILPFVPPKPLSVPLCWAACSSPPRQFIHGHRLRTYDTNSHSTFSSAATATVSPSSSLSFTGSLEVDDEGLSWLRA
jgi:hypothetical protein